MLCVSPVVRQRRQRRTVVECGLVESVSEISEINVHHRNYDNITGKNKRDGVSSVEASGVGVGVGARGLQASHEQQSICTETLRESILRDPSFIVAQE